MIIVSQDERSIINFDNIEEIYVSGTFISINYSLNNNECIAEYKTEERAKEVLQEIVKKYSSYLELKGGPAIIQGQMDIQPNIFNIPKVYVMPLE